MKVACFITLSISLLLFTTRSLAQEVSASEDLDLLGFDSEDAFDEEYYSLDIDEDDDDRSLRVCNGQCRNKCRGDCARRERRNRGRNRGQGRGQRNRRRRNCEKNCNRARCNRSLGKCNRYLFEEEVVEDSWFEDDNYEDVPRHLKACKANCVGQCKGNCGKRYKGKRNRKRKKKCEGRCNRSKCNRSRLLQTCQGQGLGDGPKGPGQGQGLGNGPKGRRYGQGGQQKGQGPGSGQGGGQQGQGLGCGQQNRERNRERHACLQGCTEEPLRCGQGCIEADDYDACWDDCDKLREERRANAGTCVDDCLAEDDE